MKLICLTILFTINVLSCLAAAAPTTQEDAVACYRSYASAVRAGKIDDVLKLVEPVPISSQPVLTARIKAAIAVEAVKTEMLNQMPAAKLEFWEIGGLPHDDLLKGATAVTEDDNTIVLIVKEPRENADAPAAWLVRRNGKWIVPAGLVIDLEPAPQFIEPNAAARQERIAYAESITTAAEAVLKRLRNKEFKQPSEVLSALSSGITKAPGR